MTSYDLFQIDAFKFGNLTSHMRLFSLVLTSILSTDLRRLMFATLIKQKMRSKSIEKIFYFRFFNLNPFFVCQIFFLPYILGQRLNNFLLFLLSNYLFSKVSLPFKKVTINHLSMTKWVKYELEFTFLLDDTRRRLFPYMYSFTF